MKFGKKEYLNWYKNILLQRRFEEKAAQLYGQQKKSKAFATCI